MRKSGDKIASICCLVSIHGLQGGFPKDPLLIPAHNCTGFSPLELSCRTRRNCDMYYLLLNESKGGACCQVGDISTGENGAGRGGEAERGGKGRLALFLS